MRPPSKTNADLKKEVAELTKKIHRLEKTESAYRLTEARLRESEARYRTIIETLQDGYIEVDLSGTFTFINDVICGHLGYTREELIGRNISKIQDDVNAKKTRDIFTQIYKTKTPVKSFELECIRKDGSKRIYELSAALTGDAEGNPVGFRSISRDITERKAMEDALRESENRLRMIVENMYDSIWTMDLNLQYTYLSPSEVRTSGYTAEEALAIPIDQSITPESWTMAQRVFAEEIEREFGSGPADPNRKRILEMELYHKNGGTFWQETTASFIRDENGRATGIMFVGRDITARKKAEQDLQTARDHLLQAEKLSAIGQLSAGVAHEILNPLNIISLELQILREMDALPKEAAEELDICMAQIDRIVAIADGLKHLSRVSDRKMDTVNINSVIAQIMTLHTSQFMIDQIETDVQYGDNLPDMVMDRKKIEQVILNLISNARGAMAGKEKKILRIATRWDPHRRQVQVMVADTGDGIKSEHLSKIFNPFFTTKEQGKGTGLGLSISYGIIKDHGGDIWAENNEEGGASFFFSLPAESAANHHHHAHTGRTS